MKNFNKKMKSLNIITKNYMLICLIIVSFHLNITATAQSRSGTNDDRYYINYDGSSVPTSIVLNQGSGGRPWFIEADNNTSSVNGYTPTLNFKVGGSPDTYPSNGNSMMKLELSSTGFTSDLFVQGNVRCAGFFGNGSNLTNIQGSNISGDLSVGKITASGLITASGGITSQASSTIIESTGTGVTPPTAIASAKGSLTIAHSNAGGESSIVFPSSDKSSLDYAYIKYDEDIATGVAGSNDGLLTIGIGNDSTTNSTTGTNIDNIALLPSGNVGIGTSLPRYKLSVKGQVAATDMVIASATDFPDYVFAHDYKLPTLLETEAYIKANKHLPAVKSAIEIADNGYTVIEMDKALLKTVEEMTLHSIAQEKKIVAQETEMAQLKSEMAAIKALLLKK